RDMRGLNERAKLQSEDLAKSAEQNEQVAKEALDGIRQAAAEAGVTKQASFFKESADRYEETASHWRNGIWVTSSLLVIYLGGFHFIPLPEDDRNLIIMQYFSTKYLIFLVLVLLAFICVRNFSSNRHNAVVDRHRQHALQTFKALVEAGNNESSQDIVLSHAASCIFSPQETGFARQQNGSTGAMNVSAIDFARRSMGDVPS
ncbi:MAG: hypothetical protein AAF225_09140, partial [Pseudomonadota bacterium]